MQMPTPCAYAMHEMLLFGSVFLGPCKFAIGTTQALRRLPTRILDVYMASINSVSRRTILCGE